MVKKKYFAVSIILHVSILLVLALGFDFSAPMPVLENTNKRDVISAVALGDTPDSKILPQQLPPPIPKPVKPEKKIEKVEKATPPSEPKVTPKLPTVDPDAIALKAAEKKKLAQQKALEEKKRRELLASDLLADIKKIKDKQKKRKQAREQAKFDKTLREQAEKSLRQQLLNEEIKLPSTEVGQSQGEVNKYKALIIQVISAHWIVPTQANKKLYSELMIRVAPGGVVLDVQVTKSSGDPALDSSARAAVLKASPLPVPSDPSTFESFREFVLKVRPENIVSSGI